MLEQKSIDTAARHLHEHWQTGRKLGSLDANLRPTSRAEGYRVQAALEAHSQPPLFGWKIAATSEAGQKHINVAGPMAGRIFAETVVDDGGNASMRGNEMRVGEPEFAFRMARDLPPRSTDYTVQDALDAVASLHPAIEIPDSRFADFVSVGEAQLIADNACAHQFVLGPASDVDWRAIDLAEARPVIDLAGQRFTGHGRNVLGDPRVALTWLVNEVRQLGITLRAGEVVTTGTCHPPLPIKPGDTFAADFGVLGKVSVSFN